MSRSKNTALFFGIVFITTSLNVRTAEFDIDPTVVPWALRQGNRRLAILLATPGIERHNADLASSVAKFKNASQGTTEEQKMMDQGFAWYQNNTWFQRAADLDEEKRASSIKQTTKMAEGFRDANKNFHKLVPFLIRASESTDPVLRALLREVSPFSKYRKSTIVNHLFTNFLDGEYEHLPLKHLTDTHRALKKFVTKNKIIICPEKDRPCRSKYPPQASCPKGYIGSY